MSLKITGKLPAGKLKQKLQQSSHYKDGAFVNLSETKMLADDASYWKMIKEFFNKDKDVAPPASLPSVKTDLATIDNDRPVIVWFGHSSYFIRINGKNILVDPVFSGNAAPLSFMVKAFPGADVYKADQMPVIDHLIITHDHYDHLDFKTVVKLRNKIRSVYCSLGIRSHLTYWGIDANIITELDWNQSASMGDSLTITATPARHFSGRGIKRNQTVWSSFVLKSPTSSIFIGGDSGYDSHFKQIGEQHGPFDIALLESGQYNTKWPQIHMMPEETVNAAIDLNAKALLPVHWGKFTLAMHPWNEPVRRVLAEAQKTGLPILTPMIGQPVVVGGENSFRNWWEM